MALFQHKAFYANHPEYFPYVMLFQQSPPFSAHAISTKAMWIHGRTEFTESTGSLFWEKGHLPKNHSEMFFVVSMSWKATGQKYHGFIDDEMFISFGIEDSKAAGIDVVAADLLQDLGYCTEDSD